MSFRSPLKSRESIQYPSNLGLISVKSPQFPPSSVPRSLTLKTEEVPPLLLPVSPTESRESSDLPDTGLPKEDTQSPSILGPISVSKFTQLSHSSDKSVPREASQVPSTHLTVTESEPIQPISLFDISSSTVGIEEIMSFRSPLKSGESIQYPSNLGLILVNKSIQFPSSSAPSSLTMKTEEVPYFLPPFCPKESRQFSDLLDTSLPKEDTQSPSILGPVSVSKCTQASHSSDESLPTETLQVPSTHMAVTESKSTQPTSLSDASPPDVGIEEVQSFPGPLKSRESIKHPSNLGLISVNKSTQFPSSSVLNLLNVNAEEFPSVLLPFCPTESRQFSDLPDTGLPKEDTRSPSILGPVPITYIQQISTNSIFLWPFSEQIYKFLLSLTQVQQANAKNVCPFQALSSKESIHPKVPELSDPSSPTESLKLPSTSGTVLQDHQQITQNVHLP
uniref:Uncharacterized protein LOC110200680 isoform X2 n=1 Tax=Phascolarctos cinereus TaxID=38626 RepID=A0A6P5JC28_PHACI|nr:uncharacterized protein LOC110200680 isoform X2 [Phascolarctos cinereus]